MRDYAAPENDAGVRVSVVIPAYRNPALRQALDALLSTASEDLPTEVIVVLNDATDEVREIAREFEPSITISELPMNLGVSGAFNHGFGLSRGEYLVQMQDDVVVEPGWLEPLVSAVESAPDVGAAGALNIGHDGQLRDAGWVIWRDGTAAPALINGSSDPNAYVGPRTITHHGSAGLLVRRAAWESVGGLDDIFYPAYYGDVDFSFRLRARGWRIVLEPHSRVGHTGSFSTTEAFRSFLLERNRRTFVLKHGAALSAHPEQSSDPGEVTREVERAAACLPGPPPPPPTAVELEQLKRRLTVEPQTFLARERDVLREFASRAVAERDEALTQLTEMREVREFASRAVAERDEALAQLTEMREVADQTVIALERSDERLQVIQGSRSWRLTGALRRPVAWLRKLRRGRASR